MVIIILCTKSTYIHKCMNYLFPLILQMPSDSGTISTAMLLRHNPWLVTTVTDLSYFCCPECQYRSRDLNYFKTHALSNHERATDLFDRRDEEYQLKLNELENDNDDFRKSHPRRRKQTLKPRYITDEDIYELEPNKVKEEIFEEEPLEEPNDLMSDKESADETLEYVPKKKRKLDDRERPFACDECDLKTVDERTLKWHKTRYHQGLEKCDICVKTINKDRFEAHMIIHLEVNKDRERGLICPKCPNKEFSTPRSVSEHYFRIHNSDKFRHRCEQCPKAYEDSWLLKQHINRTHLGLKEHLCETCGQGFIDASRLKHHLETTSKCNKSLELRCDKCDINFPRLRAFIDHYEKEHDCPPPNVKSSKMFVCPHCARSFMYGKSLRNHIAVAHEGQRGRYKSEQKKPCPHCGKLLRNQQLVEHIAAKHEMVTPYECDECDRKYGTESKLKTHKFNVHQKVKCEVCGHNVCNTFWLRRHMYSAHGIVPEGSHECKFCPMFFKSQGSLENHLKKQHNIDSSDKDTKDPLKSK